MVVILDFSLLSCLLASLPAMRDWYYNRLSQLCARGAPDARHHVIVGRAQAAFAATRHHECTSSRTYIHFEVDGEFLFTTNGCQGEAWKTHKPAVSAMLMVPKSAPWAIYAQPHFSSQFQSTFVVSEFLPSAAGGCFAKSCRCRTKIECRIWSVELCVDARLQPTSLCLADSKMYRMSQRDLDTIFGALRLSQNEIETLVWTPELLSQTRRRLEFAPQTQRWSLEKMTEVMMPILAPAAKSETFGLVCSVFRSRDGAELPLYFESVEGFERFLRRHCRSRSRPLDLQHHELALMARMEPAQRMPLYPIMFTHETFRTLDSGERCLVYEPRFLEYRDEMELFYAYYRDACRHDSPFVSMMGIKSPKFVVFRDIGRAPGRHLMCEEKTRQQLLELTHLIGEPRVSLVSTIHLPSQIRQVVLAHADARFFAANRALARWATSEVHPGNVETFTSLIYNHDKIPHGQKLCILWAHMLGIQQWLVLLQLYPASSITFVGSYFGTHPGGKGLFENGGKFMRELCYGLGNVFGSAMRSFSDKVTLLTVPNSETTPCRAYDICKSAYDYVNHHKSFDETSNAIMQMIAPGRNRDSSMVTLDIEDEFGTTSFSGSPLPILIYNTGEQLTYCATSDSDDTFHICCCRTRGPSQCQPTMRYRIRSESDLVDHAEVKAYYTNHVPYSCFVSERPFLCAATHIMLQIGDSPFTGAAALSFCYYTGEPVANIKLARLNPTVSLVALAQVATLTSDTLHYRSKATGIGGDPGRPVITDTDPRKWELDFLDEALLAEARA